MFALALARDASKDESSILLEPSCSSDEFAFRNREHKNLDFSHYAFLVKLYRIGYNAGERKSGLWLPAMDLTLHIRVS